jgi:deazaflavin-dependent oxidoreductase (nitroreductase family)
VLTTTGRKIGRPRYTMVEHFDIDGTIYVVSGWGKRAQWLKNIEADPIVTVETVRRGVLQGTFRRVTDEDELRMLWSPLHRSPVFETQLAAWEMAPTLEDFLAKRERAVILRLDRGDVAAPPPLDRDLQWVPFFVAGLLLTRLLRRSK